MEVEINNSSVIIKKIKANETRELRHSILRPTILAEKLVYYGDEANDTLHVGAFLNGEQIGIASICQEAKPNEENNKAWRLRGMGVKSEYRSLGVGNKLLANCMEHVKNHGDGAYIWCNARIKAINFYKENGFIIVSDVFEIEDIGLHYNMEKHF